MRQQTSITNSKHCQQRYINNVLFHLISIRTNFTNYQGYICQLFNIHMATILWDENYRESYYHRNQQLLS